MFRTMTGSYDEPLRRSAEGAAAEDGSDGLHFDPRDLPVASSPSFDLSVFDDLPLDEDGVPVLPDGFDRSQLPGYN